MSALAQVLKVRKQALDRAQAQLNAAKAREHEAKLQLAAAREAINSLSELRPRTPNELMLASELAAQMRENIRACAEKVELCAKEIIHYEHLHKKANLEHEKIAALRAAELEELALAKKRAEALELDEIATMLMARKD